MSLEKDWQHAKYLEDKFKEERLAIEQKILDEHKIDREEKKTTRLDNGLKVSVSYSSKVDAVAAENCVKTNENRLWFNRIFTVQYKLNAAAFKDAPEAVQKHFARAVTFKPGKPAFSMTKGDDK